VIGQAKGMTDTKTRTLSDVVSDFRFAMLTTGDLTARPLTVQELDGETVRFLVDSEAAWIGDVEGKPVLLALADPKGNAFASVTGQAITSSDPALIERLYNPAADVFFKGKDDPRIRVLEVRATSGEWWDGPSGRIGNVLALAVAKATGDESKVGDSGTIDLT
jgi:general stress protein 26